MPPILKSIFRSIARGTNLCATGSPGSIRVLATSERHGLLHAPDCYLEKIVVGPSCKGAVDLDAPSPITCGISRNLSTVNPTIWSLLSLNAAPRKLVRISAELVLASGSFPTATSLLESHLP